MQEQLSIITLMDQKSVWGKYILAQEKILENKSRPIAIDTSRLVKILNNKVILSVDQEVFKILIQSEVKRVFKLRDFDFSTGYILQDLSITESISTHDLRKLKNNGLENYIEIGEFPVIEGEIKSIIESKDPIEDLFGEGLTKPSVSRDGTIFLTLEQKKVMESYRSVSFENKAGGVFNVGPSMKYLFPPYYRKFITQFKDQISILGGLHHSIADELSKKVSLRIKGYTLTFKIIGIGDLSDAIKGLLAKGISFPIPKDNSISFEYTQSFLIEHGSSLATEYYRLNKTLVKYFPKAEITHSYQAHYIYDFTKALTVKDSLGAEEAFWNLLYADIHSDRFQVGSIRRTLSFDFFSTQDLEEKLAEIKRFDYMEIYDRGGAHKYKFKIKFNNGLEIIKNRLSEEFPTLNLKIISNGQNLIFNQAYLPGNKGFVRDALKDGLDSVIDTDTFYVRFKDSFKEKYLCEENFELKASQEEEKLSQLRREDFYFGDLTNKLYLGSLSKVNYPEIEFLIDPDRLVEVRENLEHNDVLVIFPDLKGERDKILRLGEAIKKLSPNVSLPNNNAKRFLFDASTANTIEDIDTLLDPIGEIWQEFEDGVYSKRLNHSQRQAVFKALYAPELALIQGPPGTGKSTAIAEIIWQHVRRSQSERILLTSETNLAVDNAIDRLKNDKHNLVKPIRFGKNEKLESEGRFYSLETISNWKSDPKTSESNAVSHWMHNISERLNVEEDPALTNVLTKWKKALQDPGLDDREIFSEQYILNANLIGATGSSIGKLNSENKYTSFFYSYLNVFHRDISIQNFSKEKCNGVNISFDTVIMDEASKATPPELALPVLYSKKAVIVGDHRQLPPLVDGEEIKDVLESIGESQLAKSLFRGAFEKSQFQNLFELIDPSLRGTFDTQYRMHPAINDVIAQFYLKDGGLRCGLPLEEEFHNGFSHPMSRYHGLSIPGLINHNTHVLWIDVDSPEIIEMKSRVNFGEIRAIDDFMTLLKKASGYTELGQWLQDQNEEEKEIGLISFYGKQVGHIQKMLKENHADMPVRLSTVDRFQGMERNIIIVSMVRSNKLASAVNQQPDFGLYGDLGYPKQASLGFAESPNRLNVALSRARRLLVIVGNRELFCSKDIYNNVYQTIANSLTGKTSTASDLRGMVDKEGKIK